MALLPYTFFHFLFGFSFMASYTAKGIATWLFKLHNWDFYRQSLLFIAFECISIYGLSHILCNLMMFAGHGDPISIGQKKKFFHIRPKCENHSRCQHLVNNVKRVTPSGERKEVLYEYDSKYNYHGPIKEHIIENTTTIVFFHGNGIPACEFNFFAQELLANLKSPVNVVLFEYPGYGQRGEENASIYRLNDVRDEIALAWSAISTKYKSSGMIAVGLSLGGGFSWSSIDRLSPAPKQLVLMNTFADLGAFLKEESRVYYPALKLLAPSPITGYSISRKTQSKWKGDVVVVHAIGDEFFPPTHEEIFKKHFKDDMQCPYTQITLPVNIYKKSNQMWHNDSIFVHREMWINCFKLD